jgi:cysteinyl-tRNA synthetase
MLWLNIPSLKGFFEILAILNLTHEERLKYNYILVQYTKMGKFNLRRGEESSPTRKFRKFVEQIQKESQETSRIESQRKGQTVG